MAVSAHDPNGESLGVNSAVLSTSCPWDCSDDLIDHTDWGNNRVLGERLVEH